MDRNEPGRELGRELRARRQAAGRMIASVAMDASLSVPYIANLENGRGNPTLAALQQLAAALGARLDVSLREAAAPSPAVPEGVRRLAASPRAAAVARRLARGQRTRVAVVTERLERAALALAALTGGDPDDLSERDMDRLLDLLLLSQDE